MEDTDEEKFTIDELNEMCKECYEALPSKVQPLFLGLFLEWICQAHYDLDYAHR